MLAVLEAGGSVSSTRWQKVSRKLPIESRSYHVSELAIDGRTPADLPHELGVSAQGVITWIARASFAGNTV